MNLNDSTDEATNDYSSYWQSIPDPPTPDKAETERSGNNPAAAAGRRRKRRESALKDLTNHNAVNDTELLKGRRPAADDFESLFSEASEDDATSCKKRSSKKRRSLLLPSDDGMNILAASITDRAGDNSSRKEDAAELFDSEVEAVSYSHESTDKAKEQDIVNLVRQYCALPQNQRRNSTLAAQIESLTAYPMPGKILKFADAETCKREFILRAKPIVTLMEEQKQRDIDDAKEYTGCVVKKVRGGFEYVDLESGRGVDANEYRRRYCKMLERRRAERLKSAENELDAIKQSVDETSPFADDSNMDMDESVFSPDESLNPDDGSLLSSAKVVCGRVAVSSAGHSPKIASASATRKDDSTMTFCVRPHHPSTVKTSKSTQHNEAENASHPLLGALPPSNDPRVVKARRKLFRTIDTALATYSREILALAQEEDAECTE